MRRILSILFLSAVPAFAIHQEDRQGVAYGPAGSLATLAGSGAYTTGSELVTGGYNTLTVNGRYQRGGAGGSVSWYLQVRQKDGKWYDSNILSQSTVNSGVDYQDYHQRWTHLFKATSASEETFSLVLFHLYGVSVRMRAAEVGNTGSPGSFAAFFQLIRSEADDSGG